jgi:hypothetical protein
MEQVLRRLTEAAQDPPVRDQQGMRQHRKVLRTDLVQIIKSHNDMDKTCRDNYFKIQELEREIRELRASVFILGS